MDMAHTALILTSRSSFHPFVRETRALMPASGSNTMVAHIPKDGMVASTPCRGRSKRFVLMASGVMLLASTAALSVPTPEESRRRVGDAHRRATAGSVSTRQTLLVASPADIDLGTLEKGTSRSVAFVVRNDSSATVEVRRANALKFLQVATATQEFLEKSRVQGRHFAFSSKATLGRVLLQEADRHPAEQTEVCGGVSLVDATIVFAASDI